MGRFTFFAFAFALVVIVAANGRDAGMPPTFVCTEDGYFADFYRACQVYYHCENGEKITFGCPPDTLFDQSMRACLPKDNVDCPYPK